MPSQSSIECHGLAVASLFEPINRFGMEQRRTSWGYDVDGVRELMAKLTEVYAGRQLADDPMLDFDERDLISLAEGTGFFPLHMEYPRTSSRRRRETGIRSCTAQAIRRSHLAEAMDEALNSRRADRLVGASPGS